MLTALAAASVGLNAIGSLTNAWVQYEGLKEGRRENRRTRAFQKEMWERAEGIRQKERKEDVKFREKEFKETQSVNNFNKRQSFINTILTQMNTKPQLRQNFITAQRGRQ